MAICKCTDFNIWAVTLVPFSTWNAFSTSKGFMEARWWPVTSNRDLSFLHCFCLSWFCRWKSSNLSFFFSFLPDPIPFSGIAFQIEYTSSSPVTLDACLFLKIIRVLFKYRCLCGSSSIMTCSKELWFLTREGGGGKPNQWKVVKKIVISPSWRKNTS